MLQLRNAPRRPRENLLMAGPDQQQIRQYCYAKGLLDASLLCADLVSSQPKVRLQLPIDLRHGPPSLIGTHHLSRRPLVQIGHQDFRMFRADVSPFFTQHHSDVADVPQTQAFAKNPEGFTAFGTREAGHAGPLIILARHMRDQVFERLALDGFPRPGHRKHKAPTSGGIIRIALEHHLYILLGAISRVTLHNDSLSPYGWDKMAHHLTKQGIFRVVRTPDTVWQLLSQLSDFIGIKNRHCELW